MNGSSNGKGGTQSGAHIRLDELRAGHVQAVSVERPDEPPREIIVKLREGHRLRETRDGSLYYGGRRLSEIFGRVLSRVGHEIRQSFPRFSRRLLRNGNLPPDEGEGLHGEPSRAGSGEPGRPVRERDDVALGSTDLFLRIRLLDRDTDEDRLSALVADLREIPEVAHAVRAIPDAKAPPSCPPHLVAKHQWYLAPSYQGGIDAYHAWTIDGEPGKGISVCLCDVSFCTKQLQLPGSLVIVEGILPEYPVAARTEIRHGTKALGVLAAARSTDERIGMQGICQEAQFLFSSTLTKDGVVGAIDRALGSTELKAGDVLLVEAQQSLEELELETAGPDLLPVEANADVRAALIKAVTEYGLTVIEPAGNGGKELIKVEDASGETLWDPDDEQADSFAIMVGAGKHCAACPPDKPGERIQSSNYGYRVDCQGWGEKVATTNCHRPDDDDDPELHFDDAYSYTDSFDGTSSAAAMIAGVVACLQAAHIKKNETALSPVKIREVLRSESVGMLEPGAQNGDHEIGQLPDLRRLLDYYAIEAVVTIDV